MTEVATAVVVRPHESHPSLSRRQTAAGAVALAAVAAFALAFLVVGHTRLTMPFGDSHDGRNGAQWGLGSRDLRSAGPIASHMGADLVASPRLQPYTDHPPLVYSETAAAELLAGEHPWSTRLPAWLGSVVAIGLCYRLLRRCGLGPAPAVIGTTLGLGCPMFGAYGMMNDPWILGLPWGMAMLMLWQERRSGVARPWWVLASVALVGALTSWVNVIELGLIVIAESAVRLRKRRPDVLLPVAGATAAAVLLTVAWVAWAHDGSISSLLNKAVYRTSGGSDGVTPAVVIANLRAFWVDTFTPWQLMLAIPALVAAWLDARTRPILAVSLAAVGIWIAAFSDGAVHHDYWGYWLVLPLAIGLGALADALIRRRGHATSVTAVLVATILGIIGFEVPRTITNGLIQGSEGGAVLLAARGRMLSTQEYVWYLGDIIQSPYWIAYPFHRPAARLVNLTAVDRLAATRPDDLVLVAADRLTSDLVPADEAAPCRGGVPPGRHFAVLTAADLDRVLRTGACRAVAAFATPRPVGSLSPPTPEYIAP